MEMAKEPIAPVVFLGKIAPMVMTIPETDRVVN
jgi:hypothetical protein